MATPVLISINADEQQLKTAHIALRDGKHWLIIGPFFRLSGFSDFTPMPAVTCPVVDLSNVPDCKDLQFAISTHTGRAGVYNREHFLKVLVGLGAVVSYSTL